MPKEGDGPVDAGVTSKLGGMSPLQHLGAERVRDKQVISQAGSWIWMLPMCFLHYPVHMPVEHPYHMLLRQDGDWG